MNPLSPPSTASTGQRNAAVVAMLLAAVYSVARIVDDPALIGLARATTWTVTEHHWSRSVSITQDGTWELEDWCGRLPQFPGATDVHRSKRETGETTQVKVRELCRDNDFKTNCTPIFEDQPVRDWWCTFGWEGAKVVRVAKASGTGLDAK